MYMCVCVLCHVTPFADVPRVHAHTHTHTQGTFLFGMVWSLGGSVGVQGRKAFNLLLREIIAGPLMPKTKSVVTFHSLATDSNQGLIDCVCIK